MIAAYRVYDASYQYKSARRKKGGAPAKRGGKGTLNAKPLVEGVRSSIKEGIVETRPGPCKGFDTAPKLAYYSFARLRGTSRAGGSLINAHELSGSQGRVPEWLKGTGCKPVGSAYLGSNPSAPTI